MELFSKLNLNVKQMGDTAWFRTVREPRSAYIAACHPGTSILA